MTQLYIGVCILFYIFFHYSLAHDIKYSSLCYTIESCSSILHLHLLAGQNVCSGFSIWCYGKTRTNFLGNPLLTPNSRSKKIWNASKICVSPLFRKCWSSQYRSNFSIHADKVSVTSTNFFPFSKKIFTISSTTKRLLGIKYPFSSLLFDFPKVILYNQVKTECLLCWSYPSST